MHLQSNITSQGVLEGYYNPGQHSTSNSVILKQLRQQQQQEVLGREDVRLRPRADVDEGSYYGYVYDLLNPTGGDKLAPGVLLERLYSPLYADVIQASVALSYLVREESPANSQSSIHILASQSHVSRQEFVQFCISIHEAMSYQLL